MAEHKGDPKNALLDELESIKGLLLDEDDIPTLQEVIESIEPLEPDTPRQSSLFTERGRPSSRARPPRPTRASGENPFLPQHIRARLQGRQPALDSFLENTPHEPPTTAPAEETDPSPRVDRAALIDALIEESLPELEAKLRERLEQYSQETLQELLNN